MLPRVNRAEFWSFVACVKTWLYLFKKVNLTVSFFSWEKAKAVKKILSADNPPLTYAWLPVQNLPFRAITFSLLGFFSIRPRLISKISISCFTCFLVFPFHNQKTSRATGSKRRFPFLFVSFYFSKLIFDLLFEWFSDKNKPAKFKLWIQWSLQIRQC